VLRKVTKRDDATIALAAVPFKTAHYVKDDFSEILQTMLPFFLLLMYILPVYRMISRIVSEKESKARESMKMMGMQDSSYWLSWFFYYFIIVTFISVISVLTLSANVIVVSDKGIIFAFFWIYGMSLFGLIVFL